MARTVTIGLQVLVRWNDEGQGLSLDEALVTAEAAECAGFDGFFVSPPDLEKLSNAPEHRLAPDPLVVLGACAEVTERIGLGCCLAIDDRPPSMTAKAMAGLDVASNGRCFAMIEPGAAYRDADRSRLAEALEVIRAMLRVDEPFFAGAHYTLRGAWNEPKLARPNATPVGLYLRTDSVHLAGVGARFSELTMVEVDPPTSDLERVVVGFREAARYAGRLPGESNIIGRIGLEGGESAISDRLSEVRRAGCDGIVVDWKGPAPSRDELDDLVARFHVPSSFRDPSSLP